MPLGPMSRRGFQRRGRRRGLIVGAAVGAHMANRNANQGADEQTDESTSGNDRFAQLEELARLKEQGVLTDAEFQAEKAKLLGS